MTAVQVFFLVMGVGKQQHLPLLRTMVLKKVEEELYLFIQHLILIILFTAMETTEQWL